MLTVNLEKELIRQNKRVVTSEELLYIKEYDQLAPHLPQDDTLKRVFGSTSADMGMILKVRAEDAKKETETFSQERVFHISQIEALCKKYHLKFLPSIYYNGTIDKELPGKISQFEIAYGVRCNSWEMKWDDNMMRHGRRAVGGDTYVAAPDKSFALQERPKDPLMFFRINESYYYLIHKWGNDISIIRRLYALFSKLWFCITLIAIPFLLTAGYAFIQTNKFADGSQAQKEWSVTGIIALVIVAALFVVNFLNHNTTGWTSRFVKPNDWNSPFRD